MGLLVTALALQSEVAGQERIYLYQDIHARSPNIPHHYSQPKYRALSIRSMGRYGPMIFEPPGYWSAGASFNWPYGRWGIISSERPYRIYTDQPPHNFQQIYEAPTRRQLALIDQQQLCDMFDEGLRQLDEQLGRFKNGPGWKQYFQITVISRLIRDEGDEPPAEANAEKMRKLLDRLQFVSRDETYVKISSLSGFRTVHTTLAEYLDRLTTPDATRSAKAP